MTSVFISSTGMDLEDYRVAAIDLCNSLGLVPIAMEYFEAMGKGATEGSKKQMEKSHVYVGIFAYRYGYIEDGFDKSVTELEYDYAVELGIDRLCFIVDENHPWPPTAIEYDKRDSIKALKEKVNKLIRGEFTTVENFKTKLMHSLIKWKEQNISSAISSSVTDVTSLQLLSPPRPQLIVGRESDFDDIKKRLGVASDSNHNLSIIRGWPGVGKTTLVTALAYDKDVRRTFSDNILWAALGENVSPPSELIAWQHQLGLPSLGVSPTLDNLITQLRSFFQDRKFLMIVDDAWSDSDAIPFKQLLGVNCSLLITTRFPSVANKLMNVREDVYVLGVLEDSKALELFSWLAPDVAKNYPDESLVLVRDLEGLPLAIRVAGRLMDTESQLGKEAVLGLINEIRDSHRILDSVAPDDRFNPETGKTPTIDYLLRRSTDRLSDIDRNRFAELGEFAPKPATFDLDDMKFMWEEKQVLTTVRSLVDRGLLEPIPAQGRYQMHAILVKHAQSLLRD